MQVGVQNRIWIPESFTHGSTTFSVAYDEMVEAGFTLGNSVETKQRGYYVDLDRTVIGDPTKLAVILRANVKHDQVDGDVGNYSDLDVDANGELIYRSDDLPLLLQRQSFYVGVSVRDVNAAGAVFNLRRFEANWRPARFVFNDRGDGIFAEVGVVRREISRPLGSYSGPGIPAPTASDIAMNGGRIGLGMELGEINRGGNYFYVRARTDWELGFTSSGTGDSPDFATGMSAELELAAGGKSGLEGELGLRTDQTKTTMVNALYEELDRDIRTWDVNLRGWAPIKQNLRATAGVSMLLVNNGLPETNPKRVRLGRGSIDAGLEWRFVKWGTLTTSAGFENNLWNTDMTPFAQVGLKIGL